MGTTFYELYCDLLFVPTLPIKNFVFQKKSFNDSGNCNLLWLLSNIVRELQTEKKYGYRCESIK